MKVSLKEYHNLQKAVYDSEFQDYSVPILQEFCTFCGTDIHCPDILKLVNGLSQVEVS